MIQLPAGVSPGVTFIAGMTSTTLVIGIRAIIDLQSATVHIMVCVIAVTATILILVTTYARAKIAADVGQYAYTATIADGEVAYQAIP